MNRDDLEPWKTGPVVYSTPSRYPDAVYSWNVQNLQLPHSRRARRCLQLLSFLLLIRFVPIGAWLGMNLLASILIIFLDTARCAATLGVCKGLLRHHGTYARNEVEMMQYVRVTLPALRHNTPPCRLAPQQRSYLPSTAGLDDTGVTQDTVPGIVYSGYFGNFRSV
jgi:hypothetical protein